MRTLCSASLLGALCLHCMMGSALGNQLCSFSCISFVFAFQSPNEKEYMVYF